MVGRDTVDGRMLGVGEMKLGLLTCRRAEVSCSIPGPFVFAEASKGHHYCDVGMETERVP